MKLLTKTKKAYKEIFAVLEKHNDICVFDINSFKNTAENHLYGLKLKEVYGLNINPETIYSIYYNTFGNHTCIGRFGEKHGRTISWEVDGKQPIDEDLFLIGFPTGAYIFGNDYPTEFFKTFFFELKSYNPDYVDEANKCLYWKVENAKDIFNSFDDIFKKYQELNKKEYKIRQIEKMKKELEQLTKDNPC